MTRACGREHVCLHERVLGVCRRVRARVEAAWIPLGIPLSWAATQSLRSPGRGFLTTTRRACHSEGVSRVPAWRAGARLGGSSCHPGQTPAQAESQARLLPEPGPSPQTPRQALAGLQATGQHLIVFWTEGLCCLKFYEGKESGLGGKSPAAGRPG